MNDRLAFRTLVSVAGFLLFCLACLLALSLRLGRLIGSVWVVCCAMLMAQPSMPRMAARNQALEARVAELERRLSARPQRDHELWGGLND
jgi:hypothetical protein